MSIRIAGALAIGLSLASSIAAAAERKLDKTFDVAPGGKLTVDADGTDIIVTGTDAHKVAVEIFAKGSRRRVEGMTLSAEQTGEGVAVIAKDRPGSWLDWVRIGWNNETSWVKVQVPRRYNVELRTSGGDMKVTQLEGDARGKTSGGDIHIESVRGNVEMGTSGGDVEAKDVDGQLQVHTSGGEVVAINVRGDAELETSGGDIRAEKIDGAVRAKTSGGDVDVELVGANRGIAASSSGGDIVLHLPKNITAAVDAATSGGSVSSDLPVTATRVGESKLNGTINGGGETIRVRTSGGDIKLRTRD